MNRISKLQVLLLALMGLFAAACSEDALSGIGAGPSDWISVSMATTTQAPTTTLPPTFSINNINWFNDTVADSVPGDPEEVLANVRDRRAGDRFVQVSMDELGSVLPGLQLPEINVEPITHVTSQLVFESGSSELNNDPLAALGWWSAEPYTQARSAAQVAVLTVSLDSAAEEEVESDFDRTCDRFPDREPCLTSGVGVDTRWEFETATGTTTLWYDGEYRYEFFIKDTVEVALAERMRSSFTDIDEVLVEREANPPAMSTTTTVPE